MDRNEIVDKIFSDVTYPEMRKIIPTFFEAAKCICEEPTPDLSKLEALLRIIVYESKKTNRLLARMQGVSFDKKLPTNLIDYVGKNLIIEHPDKQCALDFAKKIIATAGSTSNYFEGEKISDLCAALTALHDGEYMIIDGDSLVSNEFNSIIIEAIKTDTLIFPIGDQSITLPLKRIIYIIVSDQLEFIDSRIRELIKTKV